jgi:hypothetical protein
LKRPLSPLNLKLHPLPSLKQRLKLRLKLPNRLHLPSRGQMVVVVQSLRVSPARMASQDVDALSSSL